MASEISEVDKFIDNIKYFPGNGPTQIRCDAVWFNRDLNALLLRLYEELRKEIYSGDSEMEWAMVLMASDCKKVFVNFGVQFPPEQGDAK